MIVELICFRSFLLNKPVYITTHLWHIRVKIILEHFCKRLSVAWLCYLHCWFVFWKIRGKKWNGSFCQKRFKEIMLVCDLQSSKCPWIIMIIGMGNNLIRDLWKRLDCVSCLVNISMIHLGNITIVLISFEISFRGWMLFFSLIV